MALDVWSAGCVLGEMLRHVPVFPGGSEVETLFLQFRLLGTPDEGSWPGVSSLPHWSSEFPCFKAPAGGLSCVAGADRVASHMLAGLLRPNPSMRLSAENALCHAYFSDLDRTVHAVGPDGTAAGVPPAGCGDLGRMADGSSREVEGLLAGEQRGALARWDAARGAAGGNRFSAPSSRTSGPLHRRA
mmetsp:Transcript_134712/g.418677  ORF Transcript_134712/g.418677 Transcript_134712/m.418677 type:complete len:187 (+) Transcript_134712:587-1147(+)